MPPGASRPGLAQHGVAPRSGPDQPKAGRRPGPSTTAQAILTHARDRFSRHGYAKTSLRSIADDAGVDPALIAHFFGSKRGLFDAAIQVPLTPELPAMVEFQTSAKEPVERLATMYVKLWETPEVAQALAAIILEAAHDAAAARAMARFMYTWVGEPLVRELGVDHPELRLRMVVGFMGAIALQRQFDADCMLAQLGPDQLVELMVPTMRFILTSPLPQGVP